MSTWRAAFEFEAASREEALRYASSVESDFVNLWMLEETLEQVEAPRAMSRDEEGRPTRVAPDVGSPGKWVAQYYDAEKGLWFDMGDPRDTEDEARAYLASQTQP